MQRRNQGLKSEVRDLQWGIQKRMMKHEVVDEKS